MSSIKNEFLNVVNSGDHNSCEFIIKDKLIKLSELFDKDIYPEDLKFDIINRDYYYYEVNMSFSIFSINFEISIEMDGVGNFTSGNFCLYKYLIKEDFSSEKQIIEMYYDLFDSFKDFVSKQNDEDYGDFYHRAYQHLMNKL